MEPAEDVSAASAASSDDLVRLDGGSLLLTLAGYPHEWYLTLLCLDAAGIACAAGSCKAVRTAVASLLPTVLRDRGHPPGTPLVVMGRSEAAICHEHWHGDWAQRWSLGPSEPPIGQTSYLVREVESPPAAAPAAATAHPPMPTPLAPGRRARVVGLRKATERNGTIVVLILRVSSPFKLGCRWAVSSVHTDASGRTWYAKVKPTNLEVLDTGSDAAPARWLRLRGGWRMNHSGVVHSFGRAVRPSRIEVKVAVQAKCASRSFFNLYFSSSPTVYKDLEVFWAGSPDAPPAPPDVFTVLINTRQPLAHAAQEACEAVQLWLPSGCNPREELVSTGAPTGDSETVQWHTVVLELSWSRMELLAFFDGVLLEYGDKRWPLSFGPHRRLGDGAEDDEEAQLAERARAEIRAGFRHMYLFTWLEQEAKEGEPAPDVWVGDVWLE